MRRYFTPHTSRLTPHLSGQVLIDMTPPNTAYIALGSNLGEPLRYLRWAATALAELGEIEARSSLYQTVPVGGPPGQPDYLNAVMALKPAPEFDDPETLLMRLLELELEQGRERRLRWAARTLDLDLLDVAGVIYESDVLTLPHPRMLERAFVLAPLCEIAPQWRHPLTKELACEVLQRLSAEGIERTKLSWDG